MTTLKTLVVALMVGAMMTGPALTSEYDQGCGGWAAFETAHQMLHIKDISHADADEAINKSSAQVKAYASRAFKYCVDQKGNVQ